MNKSPEFTKACEAAGIPPTERQSSKWAMKKGAAYKTYTGALPAVKPEALAPKAGG